MVRKGTTSLLRLLGVNLLFYLASISPVARALPADVEQCITRVTTYAPRTPIMLQGMPDESFLGIAASDINAFWKLKFESGMKPDDLGITDASFERYWLNDRILIPETQYIPLKIHIYESEVDVPGGALVDDGPIYVGEDHTVYISHLWLVNQLGGRIRQDSSWRYVIAHEAGHHIQNHLRTLGLFEELQNTARRNFQIRLELQADCLAGIWMAANPGLFTEWDVQGVRELTKTLASDIHGTSEQRWRWIQRGLKSKSIKECDTFSPAWGAL